MPYIAILKKENLKRYLSLFLLAFNFATIAHAGGLVRLHGKIRNPIADSIYISYNNSRIAYDPIQQGIMLNKDGTFSTSFTVAEKFTPLTLIHGGRKADLVVAPDYDLEIIAEGKKFDSTLHYIGPGNEVANFVALHIIDRGLMENYVVRLQPAFSDTAEVFKKKVADIEQDEVLFLNKHMSDLPNDFIQYWVSYYHYFSYFALTQYPLLHEMAKQKTYYIQQISPASYASIIDIPEYFNDSLLGLSTYRLFADQLFKMRLNAVGYNNLPEGTEAQRYRQDDSVLTLDYTRMPPATSEYAVASMIYTNARQQPLARTERLFEMYKERWPNSEYITPLQRQIAIVRRLAKGQKAMDFPISTPQGVKSKLSEMKGKVVLLTFWSGAYEQGIIDLRLETKLFNKYKDSGVVFVYVSIDENELAWKSAIDKYKLSGVHTHVNGWKSLLAELYGIQSVPTFFLIDKKGNFALDHVPLPRQGDALGNEISKLLKE